MRVAKTIPTVRGRYHPEAEVFYHTFVSPGGWSHEWLSLKDLKAAVDRWVKGSFDTRVTDEYQCGGCRWFLALDSDYGLCGNQASVNDGRVTFEHGGCDQHSVLKEKGA